MDILYGETEDWLSLLYGEWHEETGEIIREEENIMLNIKNLGRLHTLMIIPSNLGFN